MTAAQSAADSARDPAAANRKLGRLLRAAYSGELAAAHAYRFEVDTRGADSQPRLTADRP